MAYSTKLIAQVVAHLIHLEEKSKPFPSMAGTHEFMRHFPEATHGEIERALQDAIDADYVRGRYRVLKSLDGGRAVRFNIDRVTIKGYHFSKS